MLAQEVSCPALRASDSVIWGGAVTRSSQSQGLHFIYIYVSVYNLLPQQLLIYQIDENLRISRVNCKLIL